MNLLIRADASSQIGTGHVMRCLALAQAWQDRGGQCIFVMATIAPAIEKRLQSENIEVIKIETDLGSAEDAEKTITLAQQVGASWVVVDGYHFSGLYQKRLKDADLKILFIDDYGHAEHYWADIVLNQNVYAHEELYQHREAYTQLLLGTNYVLLRREFLEWQQWSREIPEIAQKILVTLGGADPENVTLKVIEALKKLDNQDLEVIVVVGGSNPHYAILEEATKNTKFPMNLRQNVTNMPELMAWADIAITAGGSTCWELAFMGLPSLVIILAENQRINTQILEKMEVILNLGWYEDIFDSSISKMIQHIVFSFRIRKTLYCNSKNRFNNGLTNVLNRLQ